MKNGAEAHYDMGGKSRTHNWSPKLVFRLWNTSMHNHNAIKNLLGVAQTIHTRSKMFVDEAVREGADIRSHAEGGFNAGAEGRTSRIHCRPFTNSWMDCWKEDLE